MTSTSASPVAKEEWPMSVNPSVASPPAAYGKRGKGGGVVAGSGSLSKCTWFMGVV